MMKFIIRIPPMLLVLMLVSIPHLLYVLSHWYSIPLQNGTLYGPDDPDPWLRLTLVREWLSNGDWYNHLVARANAPFSEPTSPWTRPLDIVIAALVKLQPADVDLNLRLMRAALFLPWLWMTALIAGIFRILSYYFPARVTYLMAAVYVAMMPIIWNYFGLANADHHAPLSAIFIWVLAGILAPVPTPRTLTVTGLLLALQLWMSVETALLIGIIYSWYGLRWLRGDNGVMRQLATVSTSVAFFTLVAVMLERPKEAWFIPLYDSVSVVYVSLMTLAALLAWQLLRVRSPRLLFRLAYALLCAAIVGGFFVVQFPLALHGPMAEVTPFVLNELLPRITEVKPLYKNTPLRVLASIVQPLIVLLVLAAAWRNNKPSLFMRDQASGLIFFSGILFLLFVGQQRWGYYAYPLLAVTIAPLMAALFEPTLEIFSGRWPATTMVKLTSKQQTSRRLPAVLVITCLPFALMLLNAYVEKHYGNYEEAKQIARREACYKSARLALRSGALNAILGQRSLTILAPTDIGTEILFFTKHRIIASNYHREGDAVQYVWDADKITNPQELKRYLARRNVDAVLICPAIEQPKGSILQGIANGNTPPEWMEPSTTKISPAIHAEDEPTPELSAPRLLSINNP